MSRIDLRDEVRRAIQSEWQVFANEHPRLAAVVDESLLVEGAVQSLRDDESFRQTMAQADALGLAGDAVARLVGELVRRWLRGLW